MKGKRPSRNQKKAIVFAGLNPNNWLVFKKADGELNVIHRLTGTKRVVPV